MTTPKLIDFAYCYQCRRASSWTWDGGQNTLTPQADFWRCRACGHRRLKLGNVDDAYALCTHVFEQRKRMMRDRPELRFLNLDFEDALGHLHAEVWEAYLSWEPTRCASFLAYATWKLGKALSKWLEQQIGRDDPANRHYLKTAAFTVSLDAITTPAGDDIEPTDAAADVGGRLGGPAGAGFGDPGEDRDSSLRRAVDKGNRIAARGEGVLGIEKARRAKSRHQEAAA